MRREVRGHMEKNLGIRVLTGKALADIKADAKGVTGKFGDEVLKADLLLSAVGRKPVTEGLKLENAGLKTNERGFIEVDDYCRTKVATIFAIGDVTGKIQLAHYATSQGVVAAENACGRKPQTNETLVPNVIFTVPEVGTVGLSEDDAKKQGRAVMTGKFRFGGLGRALAVNETGRFCEMDCRCRDGSIARCRRRRPARDGVGRRSGTGDSLGTDRAGTRSHHPRAPDVWRSLDGSRARCPRRLHPRPAEDKTLARCEA